MSNETTVDPLLAKEVTLTYKIGEINDIINMMNNPVTVPVMVWANLITNIQTQCAPQLEKLNEELKKDEQPAG